MNRKEFSIKAFFLFFASIFKVTENRIQLCMVYSYVVPTYIKVTRDRLFSNKTAVKIDFTATRFLQCNNTISKSREKVFSMVRRSKTTFNLLKCCNMYSGR